MEKNSKKSGILLHISSLPGKYGIGCLGREAREWVDMLYQTGMTYWQILPLNPTGFGNSPYQGLSAFAGNPLFIDLDTLVELGLISPAQLSERPNFRSDRVEFEKLQVWKGKVLNIAYDTFLSGHYPDLESSINDFVAKNSYWIMDFAIFMALRNHFEDISWGKWPLPFRKRSSKEVAHFTEKSTFQVQYHVFLQFLFFQQWMSLKKYAVSKRISIIGDIPIFMGYDSADVWAHPDLFDLDEKYKPNAVAGVPPDYFSPTGQLWGNPLYDWNKHQQRGFSWWKQRISHALSIQDLIRLDHFRGFAAYFRIPAGSKTAKSGQWVPGPGASFFEHIKEHIGNLPFIAEDLGVITADVVSLREKFHLPGMRILQFAFNGDPDNEYLPHKYPKNCVAYTGTHDNDTNIGWYNSLRKSEKSFFRAYSGVSHNNISHRMIEMIWESNAFITIAPMQDFLCLGSQARMNRPASIGRNWEWRMQANNLKDSLLHWIKEINQKSNRYRI